ncbi:hypothetical protein J1N35_034097 [Gossypium stocksii]|uniref:Uncharacterized protein n=1 Tax=Gossypium stocksii TaxID=47602 RepID=A0A9D3ZQ41_9ROSI|nr:hypothetical protein J1N35_034097 [Gossypium stocksii]
MGQLVQLTLVQKGSNDTRAIRGKGKLKDDLNDGFSFSPKPVSVELPLLINQDPEEWISSAQDFFDFYNTVWMGLPRSGFGGCSANDK